MFRLAKSLGIKGYVANTLTGVVVLAQGEKLPEFVNQLRSHPPPLAKITSFQISFIKTKPFNSFSIHRSPVDGKSPAVDILPDLNICSECRRELLTADDRRYLYPFINCTQCGPRYTIIQKLPYDRERTTMRHFQMCPECKKEYLDPLNRRFHAEPIACPDCGPKLSLFLRNGRRLKRKASTFDYNLISLAASAIKAGKILAIKGLGGYHLAADATNDQAVSLIRKSKERLGKPLALMVGDLKTAQAICRINPLATQVLKSIAAPILLLPKRETAKISLSPLVAPNNPFLGVMLPYTPLHLLLFRALHAINPNNPPVLIMTSANPPDEPIVTNEKELFQKLKTSFHLALSHNRPIANRCDDSVIIPEGKEMIMVRRARGYAPQPLLVQPMFHVKHPSLGIGADQRNAFCLAHSDKVYLSPHIGDMGSVETEGFFLRALQRLRSWTKITPEKIVCDLHPDYHSVRLAERLSKNLGAKLYRVQHHYAHILSVMAEHNLKGPVLGLACDGTGYGLDGAIWGCEFLVVKNDLSWARVGHLGYLRHNAGLGELANPVKLALAYSHQCGLSQKTISRLGLKVTEWESEAGTVVTSSLGRLFDAVAGITGLCLDATFAGEAAIALEAAAIKAKKIKDIRRREVRKGAKEIKSQRANKDVSGGELLILDPKPILLGVIEKVLRNEPSEVVALWFHRTLVRLLVKNALSLARAYNIQTVCLSGGCFQNTILRKGVKNKLRRAGICVYHNQALPLNDGGIALGQVIAANI